MKENLRMEKYSQKTKEILRKADEIAHQTSICLYANHKFLKEVDNELTISEVEEIIGSYQV